MVRFTPNSAIDVRVNRRHDHYEVLGVARNASAKAIKAAYRRRMRELHPDTARTTSDTESIAAVSRAWGVLSDPKKRAAYDGDRDVSTSVERPVAPARFDVAPAKFPWRFVLTIIGIGAAILIVLHIVGDPMPERGIDGLITAGSCVDFDGIGSAYEVPCNGPHQAVVRELVPFDSPCDSDTTQARDRQGMGTVCLEP